MNSVKVCCVAAQLGTALLVHTGIKKYIVGLVIKLSTETNLEASVLHCFPSLIPLS